MGEQESGQKTLEGRRVGRGREVLDTRERIWLRGQVAVRRQRWHERVSSRLWSTGDERTEDSGGQVLDRIERSWWLSEGREGVRGKVT